LRIIAGEYKGRKLKTLQNHQTRPTADKVKESIFHRLGPFFTGGTCLDLFAGSGALGIEALSRGIDRAVFVERHYQAIKTIHHNLQLLKIPKERALVLRLDVFQALRQLGKQCQSFQLIFADPPYNEIEFTKLLTAIDEQNLLMHDGLIYCEHGAKEQLPEQYNDFILFNRRAYGKTTATSLYQYE